MASPRPARRCREPLRREPVIEKAQSRAAGRRRPVRPDSAKQGTGKSVSLKGKRVAVSSYTVPRFDRDSGSRRLLDLIGFLQDAGCSVTFISAHLLDSRHSRYVRQLRQMGVPVFQLPEDPVDELVLESRFDIALLNFWPVAELVGPVFRRLSPATRIVVDSVDLHFLRDARRF